MLRLLFIALLGAAPVAAAIWYSWPQLDELHSIDYPLERVLLVGAALSWLLVVVLGSMLPLLRWIEHAERERIQRHAHGIWPKSWAWHSSAPRQRWPLQMRPSACAT